MGEQDAVARCPNAGRWTKARRRAFLDALVRTCDVEMAAAAAGMTGESAYGLRDADPVFAAGWQAALAVGYDRLEAALLRHALAGVNALAVTASDDATGDPADAPRRAPTAAAVQVGLAMLSRRDAVVRRGAAASSVPQATLQDVHTALTKRLDALARQATRGGAEAAA